MLLDRGPTFDDQFPLFGVKRGRLHVELLQQLHGVDLGRGARVALCRRGLGIGRIGAGCVAAAAAVKWSRYL